jgi:hypothetical protein
VRCFRAIFTGDQKINSKSARIAVAGFVASFVQKLDEPNPDFESTKDLITIIVEAVKYRPQAECIYSFETRLTL